MPWGNTVTAIQDRLVLDPEGVKSNLDVVKEWLGIERGDRSRNTTLNIMINSAKERADSYCNREFVDAAGENVAIPSGVATYVLNYVAWQASKKGLLTKESTIQYLGSIEFQPYTATEFVDLRPFKKPGYTR